MVEATCPTSLPDVGPIVHVADQFSFETMRNNEFLNDEFVQVMFQAKPAIPLVKNR
jgi:hypothetical protein